MAISPLIFLFAALALTLAGAVVYVCRIRAMLDEMHGMMCGMGFGMLAGLITATLFTAPTGNFLWGVIIGSIAGLALGMVTGKLGGHLGVLEGIMAGPMGGMMGAMLGQMIRPFDLELFLPFFSFLMLVSMAGLTYAAHCGRSCCKGQGKKPEPVSTAFIGGWAAAFVLVLFLSIVLSFPLGDAVQAVKTPAQAAQQVTLPSYIQQFTYEIPATATQENGVQTANILISQSRYTPNAITVKKGIPLKLTITADDTAGCAQDIVFPAFNIRKIVPSGQTVVLNILPEQEGEFLFHCSMDMARGKLIVTA
jgi:heme/copper-type cytochrome/quinol oxidase subunit 2